MEREILVPLDGSELAEMALPHGMAMACATDNALRLLRVVLPAELMHTWSPEIPLKTVKEWASESRSEAHAYLSRLAERIRSSGLKVHCEVVIEEDAALGIVARAAQDRDVAMIVMATHGRTGVERWVFGSVTDKVLHATTTPLLLVRPGLYAPAVLEAATYRSIVVPLDGSMFADQALLRAQKLATAINATLLLVTVVPPVLHESDEREPEKGCARTAFESQIGIAQATDFLEEKAEPLKAEGLSLRTITAHGQPAEEILRVAAEEGADLIVLATHGVGGVQQFWMGGVATKVVQGATLPVLLIRGWEPQSHGSGKA